MLSDERLREMLAGTPPVSVRSIITELLSLREANAKMAGAVEKEEKAFVAAIDEAPRLDPYDGRRLLMLRGAKLLHALALHRGDAK